MTDKISRAGMYDMPMDHYHGDCCDSPSLSSSGAVTLEQECPAKFWWDSYLNPDFSRAQKKTFDIGTAAHLLALEPHLFDAQTSIIEADDYRTKAAKEARDAAYQAKLTPLLGHQADTLRGMHQALMRHELGAKAFAPEGNSERSFFAKDEQTGVWLKARPDRMPVAFPCIIDYKTCADANPEVLRRQNWNLRYHLRAAFTKGVVEAVTGKPHEYWFVAQEKDPPHIVTVFDLDPIALDWGKLQARVAVDRFARCLERDDWHGYRPLNSPDRDAVFTLALPQYAEYQLQERSEAGEFAS